LRGEAEPSSATVHDSSFYAHNHIELLTGSPVTELDVAGRRVVLEDGTRLPYTSLVLATGASPRRLDVPGATLQGVHYLRTLEDALRLRDALGRAQRVAVIGAGWIGSEVAASARQMGAAVALIDPAPTPVHRVFGPRVGAVFHDLHAERGVVMRMGAAVTALQGTSAVDGVVLADGSMEEADVVVVGIGVTPNAGLAARAGMAVRDGVLVDEHLEASAPGVFAAGDVAAAFHPRYGGHLRIDHWANALNEGEAAGRNATGPKEVYARLPYFFSDQYDLGLEYVGHARAGDSLVVRGELQDRKFVAFWHRDRQVSAAMAVNVWDVVEDLKALIVNGTHDVSRLGDTGVSLGDLVNDAHPRNGGE
jgi:3-phenylpropionate/trans-cinnamate dioxygenase ferredoxin reductase subunit